MTEHNPHHERRWLILCILGLAQLMVVLDATIVNIALPSAQTALHFSDADRQWVVTAYALAFGGLLLLGGRLGDMFGRKRIFIFGLVGFAVASAMGGFAPSFPVLIGARALQGAFGAILAPAALSLLNTTFTDLEERNKAFGVYGGIAVAGAAIGLLLGGVLTEYLTWRWCLYVNILIAIPATFGAVSLLHHQNHGSGRKLDIPGTLTACGGLLALVYATSEAADKGWGNPLILGLLAVAGVLLAAFITIERRAEHPLLPLRIITDRSRAGSFLAMAISGAGMFGVFLFLTFYLQDTLNFSPVETGLAFLPMTPMIMLTSGLSSTRWLPRFGPRPLILTGMLLGALGMLVFTQVGVASTYVAHVLPGLILVGLGMGLIFAPAMNTATVGITGDDAGVASAMVNTSQQVGGSLGTALLNTLSTSALAGYLADHHSQSQQMMAQAAVHGYVTAFWYAAGFFLAGAAITALVLRPGVTELDPEAEPVLVN